MTIHHPKLTVIIVVKNERGIERTLDALKIQADATPFVCLVVDASRPEVLADIRKRHAWASWSQFPVSDERTTPHQRNRGLELAATPYVAFIDANCEPAPDWAARILASLEAGEDIVTGPVDEIGQKGMVRYDHAEMKPHYVAECATINVGLRREVFERTGPFDTEFRYGQDIDFFWRATDAGFRIRFEPGVSIAHDFGDRSEQLKRAYSYGFARSRLFAKHWRARRRQIIGESHVWFYPLFILGLPLTLVFPPYVLLLLIPIVRNWHNRPFGTVAHHLIFGAGVLAATLQTVAVMLFSL